MDQRTRPEAGFTIRAAEPAEYAALGEITARAYLDDGLLDFGADDPYLERLRDVAGRAAGAEVLVAVDAGEGEGGGVVRRSRPRARRRRRAWRRWYRR
ncbi:hypothetical protein AB0R12_27205, partial [Streptomyces niveus]